MNDENMAHVEEYISKYGVQPQICMSEKEIRRRVFKTMAENNIAYLLCDVANSFFVDCIKGLSLLGKDLARDAKMKYNRLVRTVALARDLTADIGGELYTIKDSELAISDSDFYYNLIRLIEDRIGEDPQKTNMLIEFLLGMPSKGLYNITLEDFKWYNNERQEM